MRRAIAIAALLTSCGSAQATVDPLDWIAVGVDPEREADAVVQTLSAGGYALARRVTIEGAIALELRTPQDLRAIRVVTTRGVALSLDSLEPDGMRERDGAVRLFDIDQPDVDRDGRAEIVIASERGVDCISLYRVEEDGRITAMPIAANVIASEACASEMRDVDGDRRLEAIVRLSWPELALGESAPSIEIPLYLRDGAYPYEAPPVSYLEHERAVRREALEPMRVRRDVAESSRLGIEIAALANLDGASLSAQVELYDQALSGIVLDHEQAIALARVRAFITSGWRRVR